MFRSITWRPTFRSRINHRIRNKVAKRHMAQESVMPNLHPWLNITQLFYELFLARERGDDSSSRLHFPGFISDNYLTTTHERMRG
jgi:hypothetical protein